MIRTKRKIIIKWIDSNEVYLAYCPELGEDLCNATAFTIELALERLQQAINTTEIEKVSDIISGL